MCGARLEPEALHVRGKHSSPELQSQLGSRILDFIQTSDLIGLLNTNTRKKATGWISTYFCSVGLVKCLSRVTHLITEGVLVSTQTGLKSELMPCLPCQDASSLGCACNYKALGNPHWKPVVLEETRTIFTPGFLTAPLSCVALLLVRFTKKTRRSGVNSFNLLVLSLLGIPGKRRF